MNRFLPQGKNLRNQKGIIWLVPLIIGGITLLLGGLVMANIDQPAKIGLWVAGLLISIPAYLASFFFPFALDIASWLMRSSMQIPITSGWAYDVGWTFTRDLTNMFFIVILAIIALATILRIREYQFQKTLPKLIIVALLVNFSPLIVGIVVDTFNVFTNLFIDKINFADSLGQATEVLNVQMADMFGAILTTEGVEIFIGRLFALVITGAYFGFGSIIFLLIGFLYLCRTLVFWILLILAPLAFLAYVLPATRGWWTKWWSQLIQWGMVGLVSAFFLYLSSHLLAGANTIFEAEGFLEELTLNDTDGGLIYTLKIILPFMLALVFLLFGLMLGVAGGAMGGKQVVAFMQRGGKAAGKVAATRSWGATQRIRMAARKERAIARRYSQAAQAMGMSKREAFGETTFRMGRRWGRKSRLALRPKTLAKATAKETAAAAGGIFSGIADVAKAGAFASLKIKMPKKKGFRKGGCPACGNTQIAATAKNCPVCGYSFE